MIYLFAIGIGILFSLGVFMLLRRSMVKLIIGLILLSHAVNLTVFVSGKLIVGEAPVIPRDLHALEGPVSDPLPQALILTAIVISFGLTAFSIILFHRVHSVFRTGDINKLRRSFKKK